MAPAFAVVILKRTDLLGAEDPVAGIAQTGDDVALLIQVIVQSTGIDIHVGVLLLQELDALGSGHEDHELATHDGR